MAKVQRSSHMRTITNKTTGAKKRVFVKTSKTLKTYSHPKPKKPR